MVLKEIVSCANHGNAVKIQTRGEKPFFAPKSAFLSLKTLNVSPCHKLFNELMIILDLDLCPLIPGMAIDYTSPSDYTLSIDPASTVLKTECQKLVGGVKAKADLVATYHALYKLLAEKYVIRGKVCADVPAKRSPDVFKSISEFNRMVTAIDSYDSFGANPYTVLDNGRVAFYLPDLFAEFYNINQRIRIERHIENRLKTMETDDGHMCAPLKVLVDGMKHDALVASELKTAPNVVEQMVSNSRLFKVHMDHVYTAAKYAQEKGVADVVRTLIDKSIDGPPMMEDGEINQLIAGFEKDNSIELNAKQRMAVQQLFSTSYVLVLTGFPGTGKSSVVACVRYVCDHMKKTYAIMAPTGKAANRLGKVASTIHRGLEVKVDSCGRFIFTKGPKDPLDYEIIIVDEASMLDGKLAYQLCRAIDPEKTRLLIIGDPDQLPSVDAGDVLNKLIQARVVPCVCLTKIYRQDPAAVDIGTFARLVIKGKRITEKHIESMSTIRWFTDFDTHAEVYKQVIDLYQEHCGNLQVLIPSKKHERGTAAINRHLHNTLHGADADMFCPGEKVICVKNCYFRDKNGEVDNDQSVFNGENGNYARADKSGNHAVRFDEKLAIIKAEDFDYGYAITVHKSQGSEYDHVVIVLDFSNGYALNNKLLYTAIMRAKKSLAVIGNLGVIQKCAHTTPHARWSLLDEFVKDGYEIDN